MIDMQLLLRGVSRFHSDEGREFMGAVDDWLREHTVLHTTTGACDPNANSLVEESVGARKRGIRCLLHIANAPVCLWVGAAEHANEIYLPIALQGIFVGWNRRVPHGMEIATLRDDGDVEEVFTSTIVRTRGAVFPLFGDAVTKSATEAELQEFGENVRARPDEAEGPSLALRRPDVEPEGVEENLAAGEEMQVDRGREQPDPEELRRRAAEASADGAGARPTTMGGAGPASAEQRRRVTAKRPARPEERREEQRDGGGDDPNREEPPTTRQRVARAAVRLRALVAMTGKTDDDQCWGCDVVYDGGGFCDECVTGLQEQCV